ncbi:MAG: Asp-tRNA(Asn)/Glu-tRNA(Gln) amidotransferase subunit GatA [Erysipelotrichaceae bacterium]|nr:Asp-tRNA(Asn)/Glu-tRNA(Gln) amidotransferase subunit GatA [Erysipelotrichaceae bacterium]
MSKYLNLSIKEIHELLISKKIKPIDLVEEAFEVLDNNKLNAFITVDYEGARKRAIELENIEIDKNNLLFGIPIAIKDNIMVKDLRCTCASHILENFVSIYDASVIKLIKENNMIIIGKTNMDEFAMGSTSETSYFGPPINPWNKDKVPGGSSGGSAVSVASGITPLALGSDTGGSIRQPASFTGIVGMKPTYGRVSRFGLVAFASSLDQIGPMTRNVYENALLLNIISKYDEKDLTSFETKEDFTRLIGEDIKGMKIAIPNYFVGDVVSEKVVERIKKIVKFLEEKGCSVSYVDIDNIDKAVILYQIIAMGEASSNLARFDGIRYGLKEDAKTLEELYKKTRSKGFGKEVKRRIMVGSYILSGENAKTYYNKALEIRDDLKKSFDNIFKEYDLIIGPASSRVAYDLNLNNDDPLKCFMDDILVMHANMGGFPSLSLPVGLIDKMPIGMQIMGKQFDEALIYKLASFIEKEFREGE